ncbi:MAG: SgcJ/EcaC family oxidoreductase [Candidatus Rokuibacteriota bacterium]
MRVAIWGLTAALVASIATMGAARTHGGKLGAADQATHWLRDFNGAFNRHDAAGAAALFTAHADQRVSSGTFLTGRAEIENFLADLFEIDPRAQQQLSLISARFNGPDLLLAEAAWEITGLSGVRSGFAMYVLRREGQTWLCVAGRSMIPAKP